MTSLQSQLESANKRTKYAWAKYYSTVNTELQDATIQYKTIIETTSDSNIPNHIKSVLIDLSTKLKHKWECSICLEFIKPETLDITNCGHFFCKLCITKHKEHSATNQDYWKCPSCRKKHNIK